MFVKISTRYEVQEKPSRSVQLSSLMRANRQCLALLALKVTTCVKCRPSGKLSWALMSRVFIGAQSWRHTASMAGLSYSVFSPTEIKLIPWWPKTSHIQKQSCQPGYLRAQRLSPRIQQRASLVFGMYRVWIALCCIVHMLAKEPNLTPNLPKPTMSTATDLRGTVGNYFLA